MSDNFVSVYKKCNFVCCKLCSLRMINATLSTSHWWSLSLVDKNAETMFN